MAVPLHVRSLLPRNRKLTAISTKPTVGDMLCQHNSRDAPTAVVGDDDDLRLTDVQKERCQSYICVQHQHLVQFHGLPH